MADQWFVADGATKKARHTDKITPLVSHLLPKGEANAFPSLRDAARTERYANVERLVEKGEDSLTHLFDNIIHSPFGMDKTQKTPANLAEVKSRSENDDEIQR
ncbi:hypothetical protein [Nostoc sp.]|uniref:hypothetical protein n=1 Tax=Nostoc sp. TaxID=1180 RepID=UPI002FF81C76